LQAHQHDNHKITGDPPDIHQSNRIKEEYKLKLQEKQSRMDSLQRQINPHFIYNVLQLLSSIAIETGIPKLNKLPMHLV
jgi:sensor histidine kinase YesM